MYEASEEEQMAYPYLYPAGNTIAVMVQPNRVAIHIVMARWD